jgi:hypothetical protein
VSVPPFTFTFSDWDNWDNWDSLSDQWFRLSQFVPVAGNYWDKSRPDRMQADAAGQSGMAKSRAGAFPAAAPSAGGVNKSRPIKDKRTTTTRAKFARVDSPAASPRRLDFLSVKGADDGA